MIADGLTIVLLAASAVFFTGGTLGLIRFPDTLTRLHALTKADNLGLGLLVAGLSLQSGHVLVAAKLVLIWLLVMTIGAAVGYLVARNTMDAERLTRGDSR